MDTNYTPREGSKAWKAAQELRGGPLKQADIARIMQTGVNNVDGTISAALANNYIIRLRDRTGDVYYALGGRPYPADFRPCQPNSRLGDDPIVRSVVTPSVTPSPAAFCVANLFRSAPAMPPSEAEPEPAVTPPPSSEVRTQPEFVAGLLSNGELVIFNGINTIKLTREHTKALFDYLDKVTEAIAERTC